MNYWPWYEDDLGSVLSRCEQRKPWYRSSALRCGKLRFVESGERNHRKGGFRLNVGSVRRIPVLIAFPRFKVVTLGELFTRAVPAGARGPRGWLRFDGEGGIFVKPDVSLKSRIYKTHRTRWLESTRCL